MQLHRTYMNAHSGVAKTSQLHSTTLFVFICIKSFGYNERSNHLPFPLCNVIKQNNSRYNLEFIVKNNACVITN